MGGCCSCLSSKENGASETEMTGHNKNRSDGDNNSSGPALVVARHMTAPTVEIEKDGSTLKGSGLALVGVNVEQDAAYWEWQIKKFDDTDQNDDDPSTALMFGLATKKNSKFYRAMEINEESEDSSNIDKGTALMRSITELQDGDTIGVAVQQSDLPMIQFLLNGEPLHELAINRFRGSVYPSIYMQEGFQVKFVTDENQFKEMSPHARFGPLIVARGII